MSAQWILLVLEDGLFPDESICCAIKLAKRMNCAVSILMLPGNSIDENAKEADDHPLMKHAIDSIIAEGVHAEGDLKYGDKASAFLKYLALTPSVRAIVWGGNQEIEGKSIKKKDAYWFAKVKSSIQCPVVRPMLKAASIK